MGSVHDMQISRLEYLHSRGLVHGDVKPHNFAMGTGTRSGIVHLFDLEHARMYIDPATGEHIPNSGRRHATGTVRYASIAAHLSHGEPEVALRLPSVQLLRHAVAYHYCA